MKNGPSKAVTPVLGLVFGIVAASTSSIFIRFAQEQAPSITIAALRLSFAALILAPFALTQKLDELRSLDKRRLILLGASGLLLALHFATWISSLEFTSVASSVVLVTTSPLWVALISPVFLKESLKRMAVIGLVVALVGSAIVGMAQSCVFESGRMVCETTEQILTDQGMWGNFLALAGAWCAAGYLIIGRQVRSSISLLSYTFVVYGTAALVLLGMVVLVGQSLTGISADVVGWCLLLALFPQLLGHSSFNWALKYISANSVSLALLGEPVASVMLAAIFLNEPPTILEIVGGVTILVGIYLASRSD